MDAPAKAPVTVAFAGKRLDVTPLLAALPVGKEGTVQIPLRCFVAQGASVEAVGEPLRVGAQSGFAVSLRNARIEGVGVTLPCPAPAR